MSNPFLTRAPQEPTELVEVVAANLKAWGLPAHVYLFTCAMINLSGGDVTKVIDKKAFVDEMRHIFESTGGSIQVLPLDRNKPQNPSRN